MSIPEPSDAELEILRVVWREQPCSVRLVHEAVTAERPVGYTTVLKQIQRMEEKGLLRRQDGEGKAHLYTAVHAPEAVQSRAVKRVLHAAFGNSVKDLVMAAIGSEKPSAADMAEIRRLIERLEGEDQ